LNGIGRQAQRHVGVNVEGWHRHGIIQAGQARRHRDAHPTQPSSPPSHNHNKQLLSLPYSKGVQFGPEDIHELASLLSDTHINNHPQHHQQEVVRLPKLRAMFASRACRSSIMIGRALTRAQMRKVVQNLAGIEQPWNCPHGRPTMRHLLDLSSLE
jgi:DNA mismatch repair ATPase MutL